MWNGQLWEHMYERQEHKTNQKNEKQTNETKNKLMKQKTN